MRECGEGDVRGSGGTWDPVKTTVLPRFSSMNDIAEEA